MAWRYGSYSTRDMPTLRTYAEAAEFEAKTIPMRGSGTNGGLKPLDRHRKKPWINILNSGGDILICLGRLGRPEDALVRFRPNGEIVVSYSVYRTAQEIQAKVLAANICLHDHRVWIAGVVAPCGAEGDKNGAFLLRPQKQTSRYSGEVGENIFRREADGVLRYVNPLYPTKHEVNRKKLNAARRQYAAFLALGRGLMKLHEPDTALTKEELINIFGSRPNPRPSWYAPARAWDDSPVPNTPFSVGYPELRAAITSDDIADHIRAAVLVTRLGLTGLRVWQMRGRFGAYAVWDVRAFNAGFNACTLWFHADEVLEETVVTTGEWVKDPNRYFLRRG